MTVLGRIGERLLAGIAALGKPTLPAFAGMVTAVVVILGTLLLPSNATLHAAVDRYPGIGQLKPVRPYLFDQVTRFIETPPSAAPVVVMLGGSTSRESLWSTEYLADRLTRGTRRQVQVIDATSSGQGLVVSLALTEIFACRGADIVLIGANIGRMRRLDPWDAEGYFGYWSEATLQPLTVAAPARFRPRFDQHFRSRVRFRGDLAGMAGVRLIMNLYRDSGSEVQPKSRHRYLPRETPSAETRATKIRKSAKMHSEPVREEAYEILAMMIEAAQRCSAEIVFVNTPVTPEMLDPSRYPRFAAAYDRHLRRLRTLEQPGATLLDLNQKIAYRPEQIHDWGHLRDPDAMKASTNAIADHVTPLLEARGR